MCTRRGAVKQNSKSEREAWHEKLQFLSNAMESTSQPFAAGGPDGSTMIFNEAFCRLTGYTRNDLYHLSRATDLTTPESLPDERKMLAALDRTREPQRYEKYYRRKDGTIIPVELLTHVASDSQGSILFYYTFISDISDRKRKDEELSRTGDRLERTVEERTAELSRSEEHIRRMIEASPVPMVVFDESKNYSLNKKFVETFGYTVEDIPSVNEWWPLAYPDEAYREFVKKRWYAAVDDAVKNKTSIEPQEVVVTCKDSSKKQILTYFSSIGDLNLSVFYDITERTQFEEKLAHVASFPELNPAPILEIDEDGKITYRNPAVDGLFPDLVALGSDHPLVKGIEGSPDSFSQADGGQFVRDLIIDGVHYQQTILRIPEKRTTRIYCTDITERKHAEEALRENEERYRSLFEHMLDGFAYCKMLYDDRGRPDDFIYLAANNAFGRLTGVENVVGKRATEAFPGIKESNPELFEIYGRVAMTGEPTQFEIDFKPLAAWLSVSVYSTGKGYFTAVFDNITERKRAEEARERLLKEVEEQRGRLQAIMDSLPVGVIIADATGRLVQLNDMTRKIWGDAPLSTGIEGYGEYKGWWANSGRPVKPEEWTLARAVALGETTVGEVIDIQRFDGRRSTILNSAAPVKDARGNNIGGVAIVQDITRRRQLERDLSEAKAQAELYLDLMGHDISNMHQIILMQLELALTVLDEEGRLKAKDREMLTSSVKTLDRSVNLISNVRMLQKVRSGEYRAEPLDLGQVIDEVVKIYSDIPDRKISIKYAPSTGHTVMASPLIKDVLGNLVDNAVKHSKDPVEIGIDVSKSSHKGTAYYRVSVEDNGIGIPDEKKDLIFQRFKRGQTAAKGTGLGLYIVRTLVEGFGGQVKVEDRVPGDHTKGARFIVYLPVTEVKNNE